MLNILIVILVVGVLLYFINAYLPMEGGVKKLFNCVVIALLIFWLLKAFGILGHLQHL